MPKSWMERELQRYERSANFVAEGMAMRLVEEMLEMMEQEGISQAEMARLMDVSPAYLSRMLNAPPNLTLRSIAQIALALGTKPHVGLRPSCPIPGVVAGRDASTDFFAVEIPGRTSSDAVPARESGGWATESWSEPELEIVIGSMTETRPASESLDVTTEVAAGAAA